MRFSSLSAPIVCLSLASAVAPADAGAQARERQVALAVLPLPEADRATATVLGYRGDEWVTLREGTGSFICLADRPGDERFQAACYHQSLGPYMARGRELRAEGITGRASIERRWEEIEAGTLSMPAHPASLHQLFGADSVQIDPADPVGLTRLTVIYMRGATAEATGLPVRPEGNVPWLMFPGKPTAHVMISGR